MMMIIILIIVTAMMMMIITIIMMIAPTVFLHDIVDEGCNDVRDQEADDHLTVVGHLGGKAREQS